ncbi:MAG: helix-turn-helix transcriptional regulator [Eubacterium sp.]|nr:helix-turn-helix transcriptional regulator [Eubacterium sp.]
MNKATKFTKEMGRRIAKQRKRKGYTQEQLAEIADVSPQLISTAETGTRTISSEKLFRISKALNVSADYLLSGEFSSTDETYLAQLLKNASNEQKIAIEQICRIVFSLNNE